MLTAGELDAMAAERNRAMPDTAARYPRTVTIDATGTEVYSYPPTPSATFPARLELELDGGSAAAGAVAAKLVDLSVWTVTVPWGQPMQPGDRLLVTVARTGETLLGDIEALAAPRSWETARQVVLTKTEAQA